MFAIFTLFFNSDNILISVFGKVLIVLAALLLVQIIDNVTARLTKERMLKFTASFGIIAILVNYVVISILHSVGVI